MMIGTRQGPQAALSCAVLALFCALALTSAYAQAPGGWTCPIEWYNNDEGCDCNCGVWDPDCGIENRGERPTPTGCFFVADGGDEVCQNNNGVGVCVVDGGDTGNDDAGDDESECADPDAFNYNPFAVVEPCPDDACCVYEGCTDPEADNFESRATIQCGGNNACCAYEGCTDPEADNFESRATIQCDGNNACCDYEGCTDPVAINFVSFATIQCNGDNSCCDYTGCMNNEASNFEPRATIQCNGCCDQGLRDSSLIIDELIGITGMARRAIGMTTREVAEMIARNQAEGMAKKAIETTMIEAEKFTARESIADRVEGVVDQAVDAFAPYYEEVGDRLLERAGVFRGV